MRKLQFKFPNQIRISGWDFGSSARAMNQAGGKDSLMTYEEVPSAQAEPRKGLGSTFERKIMSSTIKRIALVAVASLGLGMVSAISASAADHDIYCTTASSGASSSSVACNGVAGANNFVVLTVERSNSVSSSPTVVVATGSTLVSGSSSVAGSGTSSVTVTGTSNVTLNVPTPTVGTITVSSFAVTNGVQASTATKTVTITVAAAAVGGTVDAATSTGVLKSGATWAAGSSATTDDTVVAANTASGNSVGSIKVVLGQVSGSITSTTAVTAAITGVGTIKLSTSDSSTASSISTGRSLSSTVATTGETFYVHIYGDGNSGTGSVKITAGAYSVTKSVTFYGALASLTATVKKNIVNSGSATNNAIEVVGKDAAGVIVPSQGLTITSGTTATVASYTATSSSASEAAAGTASVPVTGISGKFGEVVLTIADTATKLVTTTATVVVGAAEAASVTMSLDSSSYAPGQLITATISAKDANGVAVADAASVASAYSITSNVAVQGTLPTAAAFVKGVQTFTFYAPATSGEFEISAKLNSGSAWATAIDDTTITAKATVSGATDAAIDAATDATEAANAATDAANAAAEAADAATAAAQDAQAAVADLAAQVATLIAGIKAQITRLTNLVVKIQKKVRA